MNVINVERQIKQWICSTIETVGMPLELIEQTNGINMSYNFIEDFVGVDLNRVQEAQIELASPVPLGTYIQIMTLHELGHAMDREALLESLPRTIQIHKMKKSYPLSEQCSNAELLGMRIEEHTMNIAFEETAWMNAAELNRKHSIGDHINFELIKAHSLQSYTQLYEKDLLLYNELLASEKPQTA